MGCQKELLVQQITDLHTKISALDNLKPSKDVDNLFTKLVLTCIPLHHIDVTTLSTDLQDIRNSLITLCGRAEGLLETHYSLLLAQHNQPLQHLSIFPYYSNYLKLAELEYTILTRHLTLDPTRIAFIGSGPLPLTSIVLASNHLHQSQFHNYDIDPEANTNALNLVFPHRDISDRMFFHTTDILSVTSELKDYDVVFLAALVGLNKEEKLAVIEHLSENMLHGAILMVRSAHDARAFLYPVIDPEDLGGFEVLDIYNPVDEVINSVVVCRKYGVGSEEGIVKSMIMPSKCSEVQGFGNLFNNNGAAMVEELSIEEKL